MTYQDIVMGGLVYEPRPVPNGKGRRTRDAGSARGALFTTPHMLFKLLCRAYVCFARERLQQGEKRERRDVRERERREEKGMAGKVGNEEGERGGERCHTHRPPSFPSPLPSPAPSSSHTTHVPPLPLHCLTMLLCA